LRRQIEENADAMKKLESATLKVGAAFTAASLAMGGFIKSAGDVMKAQAGIASLGVSEDGIASITKAANEFSNKWAGTTTAEFLSASADIKGGIGNLGDTAVG
jgi:hypothetical protein